MKILLLTFLILLPIHAEDWKTTDGKTYADITVVKTEDDAVTILYSDGGARIPLDMLPATLQAKFHYDPTKAKIAAAKHDADQKIAIDQFNQTQALLDNRKQQENEVVDFKEKEAQTLKEITDNSMIIQGIILQKIGSNGALIHYTQQKGLGYTIQDEPILLVGLAAGTVDGDPWAGTVYYAGIYKYTTTLGAESTVRRWAITPEQALKLAEENISH